MPDMKALLYHRYDGDHDCFAAGCDTYNVTPRRNEEPLRLTLYVVTDDLMVIVPEHEGQAEQIRRIVKDLHSYSHKPRWVVMAPGTRVADLRWGGVE